MASARDLKTDALIQEVRELRREIKELRTFLFYGLLHSKERQSYDSSNQTLLEFTKSVLAAVADQIAELDLETGTRTAKKPQQPREAEKNHGDARKPAVDVNKEIAILKKEMAKSLREAANDIDDEHQDAD